MAVRAQRTRWWAGSVFVMVVGAVTASAQAQPKLGVTLAYQALRLSRVPCDACVWNVYQVGFSVDVAVPVRDQWQAVGEIGYARHPFREDTTRHVGGLNAITLGGGLRWSVPRSAGVAPFAQVLAGLQRDSADGGTGPGLLSFVGTGVPAHAFMVQPGVGVVIPMSAKWGLVGQIDYRRIFADAGNNGVRVVGGVRLNRK